MTFDHIWSLPSAWVCPLMTEQSNQWIIFHFGDGEGLLYAICRLEEQNGKEPEVKIGLLEKP